MPVAPEHAAAAGGRRLLAHLAPEGAWQSLAEHRSRYPRPPDAGNRPWTALVDAVEQAGLRGRGGAGFPTALKMRSVLSGLRGRGRPVVLANGTEGEPASHKDRLLLEAQPHLVLDGPPRCSRDGAGRVVIGIDRTASGALASVRRALVERAAGEPSGTAVEVVETPPGYVTGEESALVQFVNGGPAKPTTTPPRPYERGVGKRPTLVQNVETLAHVAQIACNGPGWFRQAGTPDEPGTSLVSVGGAVAHPGVVEVPAGAPLGSIIERAGPAGRPTAALLGGFFGAWVPAPPLRLPFSRSGLAPAGASPGAGVVIVLPEGACGLAETVRIMQWYADQTAGQCGPCVLGLPALAGEAAAVCHGPVPDHGLSRLQRWAAQVEGRGACKHPDGSVRLLRSALQTFALDVDRHLMGRPCAGSSAPPVIAVPRATHNPSWR